MHSGTDCRCLQPVIKSGYNYLTRMLLRSRTSYRLEIKKLKYEIKTFTDCNDYANPVIL
jgi:hypothetical protein